MSEAATETGPGAARIDRWLFGVRLFKSRSLAADAVSGGKVHINHGRVKPSREVEVGDTVTFTRGSVVFECVVSAFEACFPKKASVADAEALFAAWAERVEIHA